LFDWRCGEGTVTPRVPTPHEKCLSAIGDIAVTQKNFRKYDAIRFLPSGLSQTQGNLFQSRDKGDCGFMTPSRLCIAACDMLAAYDGG
jgi:hypothetical protein